MVSSRRPRWQPGAWLTADTLAVAWLVVLALLYLSPALLGGGAAFGPFDLGSRLSGLGQGLYAHAHNNAIGDQIEELIPWNLFDWRQLHRLSFPLWNPYSGFGMPQFFNFQSAVLSLPDLVGYLFPAHLSFLAAVATKLVLAGAGAYVFCRVVGLDPLPSAFAATVFELGGPFASEVGWPLADVMAWTGWIFAFTWLLVARRPHAGRWVWLLAASVAFAVYGGFPEADVLLGLSYLLFFGALLILGLRPGRRALARVAAAWAAGACLSAPLWLPGLQLLAASARLVLNNRPAIPLPALSALFLQGYYGAPVRGNAFFGPFSYYETVAYVGLPALVLAGVALVRLQRRPLVLGLFAAAAGLAAVAYDTGLFAVLSTYIPAASSLVPGRARLPMSFALAALSAFGLQQLRASWTEPATRRAYRWSLGAVAAVVLALFLNTWLTRGSLSQLDARTRLESFVWPAVVLALMAVLDVADCWWASRRPLPGGRGGARTPGRAAGARGMGFVGLACGCLLAAEAAFLLGAGIGLNSYSRRFFPQSQAERRLAAAVGGGLVGFASGGPGTYTGLGLIPEMNVAYRIRELAIYDPMIPAAYASAWASLTRSRPAASSWFVPPVADAETARILGVSYVLAAGTSGPPPPGMQFVETVGGERLYRVPGASRFSLAGPAGRAAAAHTTGGAAAAPPASSGTGGSRILSVRRTGNAAWEVEVDAREPVTLIARLTDVPGWHAASGGGGLRVVSWHGVLQQVALPAGRQTVRLWYWPPLLSVGLVLLLVGAAGLAALSWRRSSLRAFFTEDVETGGGPLWAPAGGRSAATPRSPRRGGHGRRRRR